MEDSTTHDRNIDDTKDLFIDHQNNIIHESASQYRDETESQDFLANLLKHSLLVGAEKLLMARRTGFLSSSSTFELPQTGGNESNACNIRENEGKNPCTGYIKPYQAVECYPFSQNHSNFPPNLVALITVLMLKLASFQISLFLRFITLPISLILNLGFMFVMFPFQILTRIRALIKKKLIQLIYSSHLMVISFIFSKLKSPKSTLRLAIRFGKALFCAFYVLFVLVGLLVASFAVSGLVMRNLVEESIHSTQPLNFDYTKTSPVALVPVSSSHVNGVMFKNQMMTSVTDNLGSRAVPYNHKLKIAVSLALPESDYNRKLGIFQVRVESLSSNGKVIAGSSHPTMLRYKSHPIRLVETLLKSIPLITGFQSEVQNLKIVIGEFTEGYEPTSSFKVTLEQRSEFQAAGSGAPEIYSGNLEISSELPRLKRLLWNWRKTMFVWIGFGVFVCEVLVFMVFLRPVISLRRRSKGSLVVGGKNNKSV